MRRLRMAMVLGSATVLLTGCSAGRTISNPFASGNASAQSTGTPTYAETQYAGEYANEYENDPVFQPSRVAIDPQPVPPARGISLTKQISLTTTVGHRRRADECTPTPTCVAPVQCQPTCVAPPKHLPRCRSILSKGRGLFGKLNPFHGRQSQATACAPQQACVAEPSCSIPEATCCIPQSVCVPEYAQPQASGCAVECCDENNRRGIFGWLFHCRKKPCHAAATGAYCPATCTAPTPQGCVTEGCGNQFHATAPNRAAITNTMATDTDGDNRSPLTDSAEDPFAQPAASADQKPDVKPPVPQAPQQNIQKPARTAPPVGKPLQADDVPEVPDVPRQPAAVPLQPANVDLQTWIEPSPWQKLQTPSSAAVAAQRNGFYSQPTSWQQRQQMSIAPAR